jgi:hypothetical protein
MEHSLSAETSAPSAAPAAPPKAHDAGAEITPIRQATAILLGAAAAALVDIVVFATRPHGRAPLTVRSLAWLVNAGSLLAFGVLMAAGVLLWRRFGPRSRVAAYVAMTAVSWALGYVFYSQDLASITDPLAKHLANLPGLRLAVVTFALSLSVPIAAAVGRKLVRERHWSLGLVGGVIGIIANGIEHDYPEAHLFITPSYPGVHTLVAVLSALLAALSFERAPVPAFVAGLSTRARAALAGAAALWAALATAVLPSNAVLLELQGYPGVVLFHFINKLHAPVRGAPNVPAGKEAWFADRSTLPPIPPSTPSLLPQNPIVILLGIDSFREDLLADEKYRDDLPELFKLRDESVYFANARAPGSSTAPSISSIFADVYYSQLYWSRSEKFDATLVFPHADPAPRFPELLSSAGVYTYTVDGLRWLLNDFGLVRGFSEETSKGAAGYPKADVLLAPIVSRLKMPDRDPQFYFAHMLDAHSPYTAAGKRATPFLSYVAGISQADRAIGRLMKALEHKKRRAVVIVYSDHGEAFGEHNTKRHAISLYDELLHVPLIVHVPGVKSRVVTDPVSLMDIAPTILDLMGVATPGHYMGQSLTGYLRGESPKLDRPIVAEARLKQSMILPDGFKVIYDTQTHVVEIYDLTKDPREEYNLYREDDPASAQRLGALTAFFETHTLRRPGYKVPYRRW